MMSRYEMKLLILISDILSYCMMRSFQQGRVFRLPSRATKPSEKTKCTFFKHSGEKVVVVGGLDSMTFFCGLPWVKLTSRPTKGQS